MRPSPWLMACSIGALALLLSQCGGEDEGTAGADGGDDDGSDPSGSSGGDGGASIGQALDATFDGRLVVAATLQDERNSFVTSDLAIWRIWP